MARPLIKRLSNALRHGTKPTLPTTKFPLCFIPQPALDAVQLLIGHHRVLLQLILPASIISPQRYLLPPTHRCTKVDLQERLGFLLAHML